MRRADALAAESGTSTWALMLTAGAAVAREVLARFPGIRRAVVLCGKGNNGGDGYVCATRLWEASVPVVVLELSPTPTTADAQRARDEALAAGVPLLPLTAPGHPELAEAAVVVDALFGSGLDRPVTGWLAELVGSLAAPGRGVVAVDVPSGLSADAALPIGPHVNADVTVELAGRKLAGAFYPARSAYGQLVLADIGIPHSVLEACGTITLVDAAAVAAGLPIRPPDAHKYVAGAVTVMGGSSTYAGAAELACRGAWRAGAGLVTLLGPERHPAAWPETIYSRMAPTSAELKARFEPKRAGALVIGPGLDAAFAPLVHELLGMTAVPAVVDAAALAPSLWTAEAQAPLDRRGRVVITPHAGEAAALLGTDAREVVSDPLAAAARLAEQVGATVVLKGPTTVIVEPGGRMAVSVRGDPAMASGGTGDVLAGVLGALLAAPGGRERLFERACAGVWLHGVAGELAAARAGVGLVATDLAEELPAALRTVAAAPRG